MTSGLTRVTGSKSVLVLLFMLILIAVLSGRTAFASSAIHENDAPCVLVLHSYHPGFIWTESISNGLCSILEENDSDLNLHIEYMDTKIFLPDSIFPKLEQLYRAKYENEHIDLLITTDDNALNFLLPRRDLLFPDVPIIFCGLNNYTESRIAGVREITGVAEAMDLAGTIELALDLHPDTRYVAVVNDNTPTGIWNLENFRNAAPEFTDRVEFIELLNLTTEELTESLNTLPDETVVLLLSFYRDQAGRAYSYQEYTALVTDNCDAPVYTAWDMFVGHGVIGGIVISGKAQGEHAALLALRVLNGESADDIPVLTESPNVPMFDYKVMRRFGISVSDLPAGRVVINEPISLYYRHKTFIWMASTFVLLQFFMILALTTNVLKRRRAEGRLRQSEARYRGIVEDQTELICRNLPDGTLTFVNDAYCRYFNRSRDELIGQSFMLLIPDKYHRIVKNYFMSLGSENPVATHEYIIVLPDGESRWNQWTNRAILDDEGQVVEFQGAGRDITERKMAEKALREAEKRYRTLVEQMPAVTYIAALDDKSSTTFISPQIESFLGVSPQVYTDNPNYWDEHLHPDDHDRVLEEIAVCHQTEEEPFLSEYRMISQTGDTIWFRDEAIIIKSDKGIPLFIQGIMTNITDRKHAEQEQLNLERQVLHAQKLESLGILAGGIAHDFNNMLTGILGNADLALFDLSPVSPVRQNIKDIETAANRAAELCQQMLAYSGKGHSVIEQVDLSELVREMFHILEVSIKKKVTLKYKFPDNPIVIMADATQIRQVIMNLITNASDAIGNKNGVISISTGFIQYNSSFLYDRYTDENLQEGMYAFLEVIDTGCGMDESIRQKLFDPFFTTKVNGRGLGLSSVQGIVRGHKGALKVYSEPGKGTTFRILLPASDTIELIKPFTSEDSEEDWKGHGTVLLADDEETVRKVGKYMLERLGLKVILAVDGHDAVEIFRARHNEIDCILLDLTMPNMDGEEAFKEMKKIRNDVRVILSSGYSGQELLKHFAGKGLIGFIQKPYLLKVLQNAIREGIEGKTE